MTTPTDFDVVVVGAGVVGLAVGAALARRGRAVLVLERNARPGAETSSRNSGVIHAGLYYPSGSWKARLCVEGRERLYARAAARGIPHRRTGKLVVAVDDEDLPRLEALCAQGRANGAGPLELWDEATLARRAPGVRGRLGLYSPLTGVVDAHALVHDLAAELQEAGGLLVSATELCAAERHGDRFLLDARGPDGVPSRVSARFVVNAAGLSADQVSARCGAPRAEGLRFCRGDYYSLHPSAPRAPFALLYPIHSSAGLGVHLTTDLGGQRLAGPDTTWVDAPSCAVDEDKAARFAAAIRRYLPGVEARHLSPAYAGVRPKLVGPGAPAGDFLIETEADHGVPGLIQLLGIESPGLTASLALGELVAGRLEDPASQHGLGALAPAS